MAVHKLVLEVGHMLVLEVDHKLVLEVDHMLLEVDHMLREVAGMLPAQQVPGKMKAAYHEQLYVPAALERTLDPSARPEALH